MPIPALILAIVARDVDGVKMLLGAKADVSSPLRNKYGHKTPLHVAVGLTGEGTGCTLYTIQYTVYSIQNKVHNIYNMIYTVGATEVVRLLLEWGADPNQRDDLSFSRTGVLQWCLAEETDG